jgi:hypothetical protein
MGWFGKGILDGDEPMDFQSEIEAVCGWNYTIGGKGNKREDYVSKDSLEKVQLKLYKRWYEKKESYFCFQVLAAMMVEVGAKFEPEVLEISKKCLQADDWAKQNFERWYHINYLLKILENYNETPTLYWDNNLSYKTLEDKGEKIEDYVVSILREHLQPKLPTVIKIGGGVLSKESHAVTFLINESLPESDIKKDISQINSNYFNLPALIIGSSEFIPTPDEIHS